MEALDILYQEHEKIEEQLSLLEKIINQLKNGEDIPFERLEGFLTFLCEFADDRHHGKEEKILFPQLELAGLSKVQGPLAVMLHEHTLGRGFISDMKTALKLLKNGGKDSLSEFISAAQSYIQLLRNHIKKENNVLFPMAKKVLNSSQLAFLDDKFQLFEKDEEQSGRDAKITHLLDGLKAAKIH